MSLTAPSRLAAIAERVLAPGVVVGADRHPLRSSCPLTRLELRLPDGSWRAVVVKQLALGARHAAPPGLYDERRELAMYQSLLCGRGLATPRFLGSHVDGEHDLFLLFLEEVDALPLWQEGEPAAWRAAAAWLGRLHSLPAPSARVALVYDEPFFERWLSRALRLVPGAELERVAASHGHAAARLAAAPRVFVHGDFYPANVLVRSANEVCVVDFELAGAGPAALDLAALVTALPQAQARDLLDQYLEHCTPAISRGELEELVLCARLHLAVRWLGWLAGWRAPAHQTFDWAAEAHAAASALGGRG